MEKWSDCKRILCIRADNMGDLIMSTPSLRALKQTFGCHITMLTSTMGSIITPYIPEIDDVLVCDLPWIKTNGSGNSNVLLSLIEKIRSLRFDAAVIFTVYSQNPLPAAMLAYLAGIPRRLSYCRENPYLLLTHWIPDEEPYTCIQHQVQRDLQLVAAIGALTDNTKLSLLINAHARQSMVGKLTEHGIIPNKGLVLFHPGVSEEKRKYPIKYWTELGNLIVDGLGLQVLFSGSEHERTLIEEIRSGIDKYTFNLAGALSIEEFIALIDFVPLVVSVNTSTIHIAAARQTPSIVLYAQTNPQHTPWETPSKVLFFSVQDSLQSKNQITRYVTDKLYTDHISHPSPEHVYSDIRKLYSQYVKKLFEASA